MEYVFKKVNAITFGMMSPEIIKKMAAVKIITPELYDKEGYPVDGGLMDVKLGVIDPGIKCKTCGGTLRECNGHFGFIDLARPIIHLKYADVILQFLRYTCRECGKLLTDKPAKAEAVEEEGATEEVTNAETKPVEPEAEEVAKKPKAVKIVKKCSACGAKQLPIRLEKPTTFLEDEKKLSPIDIRARLEKISDDDVAALGLNPGFARPEWGVLTFMPVPPVTIRPSITLETGERSEDDLTHKLSDIVRINQRLFENINAGAPEIIVEDLWELLQYHITTYFDNEIPQVPPARHRTGQALKTLSERLKSKEGRFRHNLAGKRVNYAARAVISPDSRIELYEVGVPLVVAMEVTVPERVTDWNMKHLRKFVENGPGKYPGSNYVVRPDGKKKKITDETHEQILEELQPGYVVERHLMDGDVAIFNRQPSLHRMSIMAHRVKVLPGRSFRINPSVCAPYGADFDGDEMNLHIPQTEESRSEAESLMIVQSQLIAPKHGYNIIGCGQDSLTGNYLLTRDGFEMDRDDAIQLLFEAGVYRPEKFEKFKKRVSGKEIFSTALPEDFDFIGHSKNRKPVVIKKGHLVEGVIDRTTIGKDKGEIIRAIYAQYGQDIGIDILGKIFRLGLQVVTRTGFTSTIADTDIPNEALEKCKEAIYNSERRVGELIDEYKSGKLEPLPGLGIDASFEVKALETLSKARTKVGEIVSEVDDENNATIVMAKCGSSGSLLNLAQITSCVGQQAMRGKRISTGYKGRTLSLFKKNDLSPRAKGFVRHGYKEGLTPDEYFMHAITGRDSLTDTALRTPKSGYLYRRLSNAMQDLKVNYDYSVRDANENVVEFIYGEDGIDVSRSEGGKVNVARIVKEVAGEK